MATKVTLDLSNPEAGQQEVEMVGAEAAAHDDILARAATAQQSGAFAASEDDERLALVAERAAEDPAFAALADLALRGV